MTEDEFARLTVRFGTDVSAWPAPYRQQVLFMSAAKHELPSDQDEALERLVLEAALDVTGEREMASQVLARIDAHWARSFGTHLSAILIRPATMAACSMLLFLALAAGGYQLAASQGDAFDEKLLAFATGSPASAGLLDLSPDNATENAL
jgi:hypothetical protein